MKKGIIVLAGIFLLLFGFYIGRLFSFEGVNNAIRKKSPLQLKIEELYYLIDEKYIDSIDVDSVFIATISDMISKLDPHSGYLTNKEKMEENKVIDGRYKGLGMQYFWPYVDSLIVLSIEEESPAAKAKIMVGDRIVEVNQTPIKDWKGKLDSLTYFLSGDHGDVNLTFYRSNEKKKFNTLLKSGSIPFSSIESSYKINDSVGYIHIRHFSKQTDLEFNDVVIKLGNTPVKTLILDLRGNPGGLFYKAHDIADQFLKEGELITYTQNKKGEIEKYYASRNGLLEKTKLYLLIDELSASAAEVLAGAIQDNDRGILIGRTSYGKGMVQEEIQLDDGTTLKLTTAQYYTPSGRSIQRPYKDKSNDEYRNEHKIKTKAEAEEERDTLNKTYYYTKKGRKVLSEGGIMPDVWIEYSANRDQHEIKLKNYDLKAEFIAEEYYRTHHDELLTNYPNLDSFIDNFENEEVLYEDFASKYNITKLQKEALKQYLRAALAGYLYGKNAFYRIWQEDDAMINQALEMELE